MRNFIWKYRGLLFCAGIALTLAGIFNCLIPLLATENILVTSSNVKADSRIEASMLKRMRIPKHLLQQSYFQDEKELVNQVIRYDVPAGTPILKTMVMKSETGRRLATVTIVANGYLPSTLKPDTEITLHLPKSYIEEHKLSDQQNDPSVGPRKTAEKTTTRQMPITPALSGRNTRQEKERESEIETTADNYLQISAKYLGKVSAAGILGGGTDMAITINIEQKYTVAILKASADKQLFISINS